MSQGKVLEQRMIDDRYTFLDQIGLDSSIVERFGLSGTLTDVATMRDSHRFFSELRSDTKKIFTEYPQLLAHNRTDDLEPKLRFLTVDVGIRVNKVKRLPELFTYALSSMKATFEHYSYVFHSSKEAQLMFQEAPTLFGNDTDSIERKIRSYRKAGILFQRNYQLLEIRPENAIDTRTYLTSLGIKEPEKRKWYHMLLTVSRSTLQPKVDYCEQLGIDWRVYPSVLLLGLGTDRKKGALPRRVELFTQRFPDGVPRELDYRKRPHILTDLNDTQLKNRIDRYVLSRREYGFTTNNYDVVQ
jgi:hypothetical protein